MNSFNWVGEILQGVALSIFFGGAGIAAASKKSVDAAENLRQALESDQTLAKTLNEIGGNDGPHT
jgi:hypothetical protein